MNDERFITTAAAATGIQLFSSSRTILIVPSVEVSPLCMSITFRHSFFLTSRQTSAQNSLAVTARTAPAAAYGIMISIACVLLSAKVPNIALLLSKHFIP